MSAATAVTPTSISPHQVRAPDFFAERDRRRKVQHAARRALHHAGALLDLIDLAENAVALDAIDARLPRLITLREQSYAV
jgi:hypothetical protein